VTRRLTKELTAIEQHVIAEIRAMRASLGEHLNSGLLADPTRLIHHFIQTHHGHVQLHVRPIARELGIEMRTLHRNFVARYGTTLLQYQVDVRLAFCRWLLSIFPPTKISAIASTLGYKQVRDFNRFFQNHMHQSPSEWSRKERERIERKASGMTRDRNSSDS
jgi:transcriptional regulator GlxA family with amidase domain